MADALAGAAIPEKGQALPTPFVRITGLRKVFSGSVAVDNVSFEVPCGSTTSLLGPSGCGKTTTLRAIAGLEAPDSGRISIGDTVVFDSKLGVNIVPEKRELGMVFQSYAVWPHMTVGENVGFPLKVRRMRTNEADRRVRDALSLVGLGGLGGRPATQLSGGQQQRVALARAIVHGPRLVLFDEPLSNLDAKLRQQMRAELKLLQTRLGFTAIYVTHDQQEALGLSDSVIVMNRGIVEAAAAPRELFARPATPFAADFLGFDNMYEGRVVSAGERPDDGAQPITVQVGGQANFHCLWNSRPLLTAGTAVTLAFRSERVVVRKREELYAQDTNMCVGTIRASVYLGTGNDYVIDGGPMRVRAVGLADSMLKPGDAVAFSIDPEHCIVFLRNNTCDGTRAAPTNP